MSKLPKRWTLDEDRTLRSEVERQLVEHQGEVRSWKEVADRIPGRNNKDCRKRYYNEVMGGFKKGPWTKSEDDELKDLVTNLGPAWATVSKQMKNRTADQCSKRWNHSLDPNLDHSAWTHEENILLSLAARIHGSLWKDIQAIHFPERSSNNIKNQYTILSRKGFKAPSNSTSCCEKKAKRKAADCDDYNQDHATERPVEPLDFGQMDTTKGTDHPSLFDHTLGSDDVVDGTGYNSFFDEFHNHDSTSAGQNQTFQPFLAPQMNDLLFPASASEIGELQNFDHFSTKNTFSSSPTVHLNSGTRSQYLRGFSSMFRQQPNSGPKLLPESPANELASSPKSSSSDQATVSVDDDMSDSDELGTESAGRSNQPCSKQKRRITITLEHADPKTLANFLNAALHSEAKISIETQACQT